MLAVREGRLAGPPPPTIQPLGALPAIASNESTILEDTAERPPDKIG